MRKPLALVAIATAAVMSIATSPPPSNPVFYGNANAAGPNFLVSAERPDWRFRIGLQVELPAEAETEEFESFLDVNLVWNHPQGVSSGLVNCDDGTILDDDLDEYLRLDGVFADCPIEALCEVVVCLDVASDGTVTEPIEWTAEVRVQALDELGDDEPGLEIPVGLAIAEMEISGEEE